ncbi:MAG: DotU family type IV/VI secretion system protein [Nitrospirota bacterium]|nr:DotU family type IV/VI secretion system protein [Nitrospirota bacterium]
MRLVDCFTDVLAYAKGFLQQPSLDYQAYRSQVLQMLGQAAIRGRQAGFSAEDCDAALFAVVAWIDEATLSSGWSEVGRWQKEPLQGVYFKTAKAGLEFYTRLDMLAPQQRHIREVYFLCLLLGFRGRYVYQTDRDVLRGMQHKHLSLLFNDPALLQLDETSQLFPSVYPVARPITKPPKLTSRVSALTLNLVVTPVLVVVILYATYHVLLSNMVADFTTVRK